MKIINITLLIVLFCINFTFCQENESVETEITTITIIEDVPVFPGCEAIEISKRRVCLQEKIQEHIKLHFNYPKNAIRKNIQGKVYVSFVIEKDGTTTILNVRGPHEILENEAKRIIELLPKMQAGKVKGEPSRMSMSIPISFALTK